MVRGSNSTGVCFREIHLDTDDNDDEQGSVETTKRQVPAAKGSSYDRQQRFHAKQRRYVDRLETTVKYLRMDVDQQFVTFMKAQTCDEDAHFNTLDPLASRLNVMEMDDVVTIMRECLQSFESGVQARQSKFLESAMRRDVHNGDFVGRDSILEQWMRFGYYFDGASPKFERSNFHVDMLGCDATVGYVNAILVTGLTHLSLAAVFPRCLAEARLRDKLLLDSTLHLPMTAFFHLDEQGKVSCYEPAFDFVTGLYKVLGNLQDVACILQSANIDASGQINGDLPLTQSQPGSHSPRRHNYRAKVEGDCYRTNVRVDKFSVPFLLSSDEGVRSDIGGQTAS